MYRFVCLVIVSVLAFGLIRGCCCVSVADDSLEPQWSISDCCSQLQTLEKRIKALEEKVGIVPPVQFDGQGKVQDAPKPKCVWDPRLKRWVCPK